MADTKECNITEPHRGHAWNGVGGTSDVPAPTYHMCPGKFRAANGDNLFAKAVEAVKEQGEIMVSMGDLGFIEQVIVRLYDAGFLADPASVVGRPMGEDHDTLLEEHIHTLLRPAGLSAEKCKHVASLVARALNRGELKADPHREDANADISQEKPQETTGDGLWVSTPEGQRLWSVPEPVMIGPTFIPAGYALVNGVLVELR